MQKQVHQSKAYFYGYDIGHPTHPGVLYTIKLSLLPPDPIAGFNAVKIYELYLTKSTVFEAGLIHLTKGEELYIEFYDGGVAVFVTPTAGYDITNMDVATPKQDQTAAKPKKRPEDMVNLCTQSVMHVCTGCDREDRKARCDFWVPTTTGEFKECSHFRKSYGGACDNIKAHMHLQQYGPRTEVTTSKKITDDRSYDQIMKDTLGHKV